MLDVYCWCQSRHSWWSILTCYPCAQSPFSQGTLVRNSHLHRMSMSTFIFCVLLVLRCTKVFNFANHLTGNNCWIHPKTISVRLLATLQTVADVSLVRVCVCVCVHVSDVSAVFNKFLLLLVVFHGDACQHQHNANSKHKRHNHLPRFSFVSLSLPVCLSMATFCSHNPFSLCSAPNSMSNELLLSATATSF